MNRRHRARIRKFRNFDLVTVRRLIQQTIDVCYSGVYPPRAVQFFKDLYSDESIMKFQRGVHSRRAGGEESGGAGPWKAF